MQTTSGTTGQPNAQMPGPQNPGQQQVNMPPGARGPQGPGQPMFMSPAMANQLLPNGAMNGSPHMMHTPSPASHQMVKQQSQSSHSASVNIWPEITRKRRRSTVKIDQDDDGPIIKQSPRLRGGKRIKADIAVKGARKDIGLPGTTSRDILKRSYQTWLEEDQEHDLDIPKMRRLPVTAINHTKSEDDTIDDDVRAALDNAIAAADRYPYPGQALQYGSEEAGLRKQKEEKPGTVHKQHEKRQHGQNSSSPPPPPPRHGNLPRPVNSDMLPRVGTTIKYTISEDDTKTEIRQQKSFLALQRSSVSTFLLPKDWRI